MRPLKAVEYAYARFERDMEMTLRSLPGGRYCDIATEETGAGGI